MADDPAAAAAEVEDRAQPLELTGPERVPDPFRREPAASRNQPRSAVPVTAIRSLGGGKGRPSEAPGSFLNR